MASIDSEESFRSIIQSLGKAGLNAIAPNDFEYYAVTLELVDSQNLTIDHLTFPVSPENIEFNKQSIVNIKKSMGGVTALDTESFIPAKYNMSGTFGRKLRLLLDFNNTHKDSNSKGNFDYLESKGLSIKTPQLNAKLKSGYGTMKLLESIINKSSQLDQYNKPAKLYLYNPALGHSFVVKINNFTANQNYQSSNAMWRYSLMMTAISPLDASLTLRQRASSLLKLVASQTVQRGVSKISNSIKNAL